MSTLPSGAGGGGGLPGRLDATLRRLAPLPDAGETELPTEAAEKGAGRGGEAPGETGDDGPPGNLPQAGEIYYPAESLSKQVRALTEPDLERGDIAGAAYVGPVRLRLWISRGGRVVDLAFEGGELPPGLSAALREAFMPLVFSPAEIDGVAVATSVRIEIDFAGLPSGDAR